jgi:hypothetical protein
LADEFVTLYESPEPQRVFAYSPGICRLPGGRLVATMDQGGPGVKDLPGAVRGGQVYPGRVYTSDDRGRTWQHRADTPMIHARPFVAGNRVYVLGHRGDLMVTSSRDQGETWSQAVPLTRGERWHQAPCNVHYTRGKVYLVMERHTDPGFGGWAVAVLAPVLMSASQDADLTRRESWTFSNVLSFRDAVAAIGEPRGIPAPFFSTGHTHPENPADRRTMNPIGWLETNVVEFFDPDHVWHDPAGRTFYLWMRAHTGSTNLACIAKATEADDGTLTVSPARLPSGQPVLYVPCPGGHLKFHILWDEPSRLFWLVSSQATDSMTRPDRLPATRYNLPNNERHRLALHFSRNCIDWCFAGMVAVGKSPKEARNYASMVVDGDDLHILSRSGDARAKSAHDGNLITFHTVQRFRELVY